MGLRWGHPKAICPKKGSVCRGVVLKSRLHRGWCQRGQVSQALPRRRVTLSSFTCSYQCGARDTTLSLPKEPWLPHLGTGRCPREAEQVGSSQLPLRPQEGGGSSPRPDELLDTRTFPCWDLLMCREPIPDLAPRGWGRKPQLLPLCIQAGAAGQEAGGG